MMSMTGGFDDILIRLRHHAGMAMHAMCDETQFAARHVEPFEELGERLLLERECAGSIKIRPI